MRRSGFTPRRANSRPYPKVVVGRAGPGARLRSLRIFRRAGAQFPLSLDDYRALIARSVRSLCAPRASGAIFDRTPLDYLAYLVASGADPAAEVDAAPLRPAFTSLDLLVITVLTLEVERVLPAAELSGLRLRTNEAVLELAYEDPLNIWENTPLLELDGPLDNRVDAVLAALK